MALLGDLVVTLEADSTRFEKGMDRSRKQLDRFEKSTAGAFLSSNKFRGGLTQASFAVDDFFGVLAAGGGVGAAIRSTSNNIGTLVTAINPIAGIATTLGLTLGSVLIPKLFDTGEAAENAAKKVETLEQRLKKASAATQQFRTIQQQQREVATAFDTQAIESEIERVTKEFDAARDKLTALRREQAQLRLFGGGTEESQKDLANLDKQIRGQIDAVNQLRRQFDTLERNKAVAAIADELDRLVELESIKDIASLDSVSEQLDEVTRKLHVLGQQSEEIGKLREGADPVTADAITKELERRSDEIAKLQETLEALREQEAKLFGQQAAQAALGTTATGAAGLPSTVERKIKVVQDERRLPEDRFAGFAERGSAAAFSAILKATRPDQQSKSLASIEKTNKTIAKSGADTAKAVGKIAAGAGNEVRLIVVDSFT